MDSLRRVGDLLQPHKKRIAAAMGLAGLTCALNLPAPLLIQGVVDDCVVAREFGLLPVYALLLLVVFAAQAATGWCSALLVGRAGLQIVRELRHRLYARLQRVGLSFYEKTPAGAIISRLMDDVTAVQNVVSAQTLTIVTDLATATLVAGLLLWRSPRMFLVVVAFLPFYALGYRWFGRRIRSGTDAVRSRLDGVFGQLKEKFDGVLVVKAHAREEAEMADFAARIDAAHEPRLRVERMVAAFCNLSVATGGIGVSAVFAVAAFDVLHGRMTPGEAVAVSVLAGLLFGPITRLADLIAAAEKAAASIRRLGEVLEQDADVPETDRPLPLERATGLVEFDHITFGYRPGRPVLWDLSLRVDPGTRIALVGPTGCGKTTLLNLLQRFYDPMWGEIRLDGVPIRRLALADLRRQIGIVPQEAIVFHQTLAENIRYGVPGADDARVMAAAKAALVHGFAATLPRGYQTVIGEGGYKLSQGERQRVAIARAVCKDPALIVLDEATSSLDSESEALIRAALANLLRGRTAFIIAHRLTTVLDADQIIVLNAGEVVQTGTHAELFADERGLYRQLCLEQFGIRSLVLESRECQRPEESSRRLCASA
jgi:subfamily B ATP-binding cassette protein MsbA